MLNSEFDAYKKTDILRNRAGVGHKTTEPQVVLKRDSVKQSPSPVEQGGTVELQLHLLDRNPHQPRLAMDPVALAELASTIKEFGLLQPIEVVEGEGGRYIIVFGHRRVEAHKLISSETIRAKILTGKEKEDATARLLIENIQRDNLNPIEYALSFQGLLNEGIYKSASELAFAVGKNKSTISKYLGLLTLPADIVDDIGKNKTITDYSIIDILRKQPEEEIRVIYQWYKDARPSRAELLSYISSNEKNVAERKVSFSFSKSKSTIVLPALDEKKQKELEKLINDFIGTAKK